MASQPQPLHPALPCTAAAGTGGLAGGTPSTGTARPKPPLRPKPRVLPKPAVPAKAPPPGLRHLRPELPSAEKMNRLAGPQPYGAGSAGGPLRRPSFTIKSPEVPAEKGLPSPIAAAGEAAGESPGEEPPAPPTPSRKGPVPFKVTPVPVATKLERFPGTTVEQILAKMDTREGPGSPDRARLCPDPSSRFGSKPFTAFRRRPSGEADGPPPGDAPQPAAGELRPGDDGQPTAEMSGSPPAGPSSAGAPCGRRSPRPPPDLFSLQLGTPGPPGSPRTPSCLVPALGAPSQPCAVAPGSPHAPPELLAPSSPTRAPGSPESRPPAGASAASIQAPGGPSSTAEPQLSISRSPGSPHTPGEGSPDTATPPGTPVLPPRSSTSPGTPQLPPRVTCPPGSPEAAVEYPASPSPPPEPPGKASRPPGSPEGPDDPPVSPLSPEGPNFSPAPPCRDSGLRRSSEGVLQPPAAGQGMGGLGGSLGALPWPGDLLQEPALGSESGWSLSQSFEWTFPSRGARRVASPPSSPIRETGDSDGEDAAPGAAEPGPQGAEGAPCPGGPMAQAEAEGSSEEGDDGQAEQDVNLCVTEPGWDPPQPQPHIKATPPDPAPPAPAAVAGLVWAPEGDSALSLQGPGGPGQAGGSPRSRDAPGDPAWLTELLASPGAHTGQGTEGEPGCGRRMRGAMASESGPTATLRRLLTNLELREQLRDPLRDEPGTTAGLLGWSRKDLSSEFGIGTPRPSSTFHWTRERDWPRELQRDRELSTERSWGSAGAGDQPFGTARSDWGSGCRGTELPRDAGLGHSDWHKAPGAGESCRQGQDVSASKPTWGTSYGLDSAGSGERIGSGNGDWSSSYSVGTTQHQDEELNSRQPSWAGRYGSGDLESQDQDITSAWAGQYGSRDPEMKDRELSPDWASKYSSRGAETMDKDLTLGWAGRSSTGDTGTPGGEFSPSRTAWDSKYSSRDMESQDREFSPSRPAEADGYSTRDMESQDREFSPSRLADADGYSTRDMENQDREFSPSRPAEADGYSTRDMENQDREFSPSRPAWEDRYSTRAMESPDQEFRPAWTSECSTRDMEDQDWEFSPGRPAWDSEYGSRDMENQDREFSSSRSAKASESSTRDVESQDGEFEPSRPAWEDRYSTGDVESLDHFSPSRLAEADGYSTRDRETQNREFSPGRPPRASELSTSAIETWDRELSPGRSTWNDQHSTRDVETWNGELSSGRPTKVSEGSTRDMESLDRELSLAWEDRHSTKDIESQDRELSLAWEDRHSNRHMESQDSGFKPSRPAWDDEHSIRDMESQEQELRPSRAAEADGYSSRDMEAQNRELSPGSPAWASECSSADTREEGSEVRPGHGTSCPELVDAAAVGKDLPGFHHPDPPSRDPGWGSAEQPECGATGSRDWAEEPGAAECHVQLSVTCTERGPAPSSAAVSSGGFMPPADAMGPPGDQHRDVSCSASGGAGLWERGCSDAEAQRREWADAFGARCAARSRGVGEQHPGGDTGSMHSSVGLWDSSPQMGDPPATGSTCTDPPSPTEEQRDPLELTPALWSPRASPPLPEAAGGTPPATGSGAASSDHPDGKRPHSQEEKHLPMGTPEPEAPPDLAGQEFTFLEEAEVLDSRVFRSKAELGRQRRHRAPALRPAAAPDGDSWLFRDSTEPRPAAANEEAAAEPRSRWAGRAGKVPLFPGLSAAALKAKLRGRNRSAEEGTPPGDSKVTPPRDPHVQRSKSCKIPGLSGKPLVLPPKPERSSGSDASPPHWLQALKLKKKKP